MGVLSIALGQWEDRDDSKAQPEVRQAANTAMDTIDAMLASCTRCGPGWCPRSAPATTLAPPGWTRCWPPGGMT